MAKQKMTEKQKRFADEYIITLNAYQSAINAGYSENYAKAQSHKLLENVGIKNYIDEKLAEIESEKTADQKEVMHFLTSVVRNELTEQQTVAGQKESIEVETSIKDRLKAAELLGKRYSMWTDKVEQTNRNIEINVGDWDDD